jgi:hypothetical protein
LIENAETTVGRAFRAAGDAIVLLGESRNELGGSEYLKLAHGLIRGVPPALDLAREAALHGVLIKGPRQGSFVRRTIAPKAGWRSPWLSAVSTRCLASMRISPRSMATPDIATLPPCSANRRRGGHVG